MKQSYIIFTLFAALSSSALFTKAQNTNVKDILAQEQESISLQWEKSTNAAGLLLDQPAKFALAEVGYAYYDGNFRRPQAGSNGQQLQLDTRGNLYLKNYYVTGYFSYKRHNKNNANYNAGLIDPFRNMPYIVADTNASDWLNQHYNLGFSVTTEKVAEQLALGIGVDYEVSSGAKQRDIRTLNKYYALKIEPGAVYEVNESNHFGANFLYKNYKEESANSNINNYVNQGYFVLFGLGNAINYVGSGRTMNYQGDVLGGGLQYQYRGDISLFAAANYAIQAEDANIGFTNSRPQGTILQRKWDFNLNAEKESGNFKNIAQASYTTSKSKGIEYISEFQSGLESDGYYVRYKSIRSKYNYSTAEVSFQIIRKSGDSYNWKARVRASYDKLNNRYLIPASDMLAENMSCGISLSKSFDLSAAHQSKLAVGVNFDLRTNLNGQYNYNGADPQEVTVVDLEQRNYEYLTSAFKFTEVPLVYSQRLIQSNTTIFFKASGYIQSTGSYQFNNRKGFLLGFGATF